MPDLVLALDPVAVHRNFNRHLQRLAGSRGVVYLRAIRVTRYKPGRRCVIEYDVMVERAGDHMEASTLIGKVRAGHSARAAYRRLKTFWKSGFEDKSPDGYSVPRPIGIVPTFNMWIQRKVPGRVATDLIMTPGGTDLARRIAEAAHKLHLAKVQPHRCHTMADELHILRERLPRVTQMEPRWAGRIDRIREACEQLGARTPQSLRCGIHRDFYPDQVIVDGPRLYLIDFDLYCEGDPGLDIGNFLGHITEQSLRTQGDPEALLALEQAMEERFVELAGEVTRPAVRVYATLTLVRHIHLSTLLPERRRFTRSLLELCEKRLGIARRPQAGTPLRHTDLAEKNTDASMSRGLT